MAKGTPNPITSPPVSFSDALNNLKPRLENENAREGDTPRARTTTASASQPLKTGDDEEEVELRTPGSLDVRGHGSGGVREAGAGTVGPFYAVSTLGILWRQMQLR